MPSDLVQRPVRQGVRGKEESVRGRVLVGFAFLAAGGEAESRWKAQESLDFEHVFRMFGFFPAKGGKRERAGDTYSGGELCDPSAAFRDTSTCVRCLARDREGLRGEWLRGFA